MLARWFRPRRPDPRHEDTVVLWDPVENAWKEYASTCLRRCERGTCADCLSRLTFDIAPQCRQPCVAA